MDNEINKSERMILKGKNKEFQKNLESLRNNLRTANKKDGVLLVPFKGLFKRNVLSSKTKYYGDVSKSIERLIKDLEELDEILNTLPEDVFESELRDISNSVVNNKARKELKTNIKKVEKTKKTSKNTNQDKCEYSLNEDIPKGTKPKGFKLKDCNVVSVSSWTELYIKVCEKLFDLDNEKFESFCEINELNGQKRKYFSILVDKNFIRFADIRGAVFIETNFNSEKTREMISKILKEYGFSNEDFKIFF